MVEPAGPMGVVSQECKYCEEKNTRTGTEHGEEGRQAAGQCIGLHC